MSVTYKPKKKKRKTSVGFLARSKSKTGRNVIARRRRVGRRKLAA